MPLGLKRPGMLRKAAWLKASIAAVAAKTATFGRLSVARCMASAIFSFLRFSQAIDRAVFGLYPARMAACVPFKSNKYSLTKRVCFGFSLLLVLLTVTKCLFEWGYCYYYEDF